MRNLVIASVILLISFQSTVACCLDDEKEAAETIRKLHGFVISK